MFEVETDLRIVPFGDNLMRIYQESDGSEVANATLAAGVWTISDPAAKVPASTADSVQAAVLALTEHATTVLGGTGYSTIVPHGLT